MIPCEEEAMSTRNQIKVSREYFQKGRSLYEQHQYAESCEQYHRAVQLQEISFGKYHKETIRSYFEFGKTACKVVKYDNNHQYSDKELISTALKSFQRAIRMANVSLEKKVNRDMWKEMEQSWYEIHPSTDLSLGMLSEIFASEDMGDKAIKQHQYVQAIENYCEALSLQDSLLGRDSIDGADIRYKLGSALMKTSSTPQAQKILQLAYKCYLNNFGKGHPATMGCLSKIETISASS